MNKILGIPLAALCLLFVSCSHINKRIPSSTDTSKRDVLNSLDELYEKVAQSQGNFDYSSLLNSINDLIKNFENGSSIFTCTRDGNGRYRMYDSKKGETYGYGGTLESCNSTIESSKNGFVCTRDGNGRYRMYDSKKGETYGYGGSLESCISGLD